MRIAAQELRTNGVELNKSKLRDSLRLALANYSRCNLYLYNKCILDSPTAVDWLMIKKFFRESYPLIYSKMSNALDGTIDFTSDRLRLILGVDKEVSSSYSDLDDLDILGCIKNLLYYKEVINDLNSIYDNIKFKKKTDILVINPFYAVGSKVQNKNKFSVSHWSSFTSCISGNNRMIEVNSEGIILDYLCKKFSYDYGLEESIFFNNASRDYDIYYLDDILSGKIKGNTLLAIDLYNDIVKYYKEFTESRTNDLVSCLMYKEHIFNDVFNNIKDMQTEFRNNNKGARPVYISNYSVIYALDEDEKEELPTVTKESFGLDCVDYYGQTALSIRNQIQGYSGEFVNEKDIVDNNLVVVGCPLELETSRGKKELYYPLVNVYDSNGNSLEPLVGTAYNYTPLKSKKYRGEVTFVKEWLDMQINFESANYTVLSLINGNQIELIDNIENELNKLGIS